MEPVSPTDWRKWPRIGNGIEAPAGASTEACFDAVWGLTCEEYGLDPLNPPPLRRDVVRKVWLKTARGSDAAGSA